MEEVDAYVQELKIKLTAGEQNRTDRKKLIMSSDDQIIGEVSWYWKSEETAWMEIGILIFDPQHWSKGIGFQALTLWITELFDFHSTIVRLGLSTWSGNTGMIHLAEKLGMQKEAVYRKARVVNGVYYDSISYGILREEWSK